MNAKGFEVFVNGKSVCVAGLGRDDVLTAIVDSVAGRGRNKATLRVGGLIVRTGEHVEWRTQRLKRGDEVRVRVVERAAADPPKERHQRNPAEELNAQKRYVREMARKLGWQIVTNRKKGPNTV